MRDISQPTVDPVQRELQIRERVASMARFYRGLMAYLIAVPLMVAVNFFAVPRSGYWSLVVAGVWGVVIALEAVQTFWMRGWLSKSWEARKVEELMRREREKRGQ